MKKNIFVLSTFEMIITFLFLLIVINNSQSQGNSSKEYSKIAEKFVRVALQDQQGYKLLEDLCKIGHRLTGSENSLKSIIWAKKTMEDFKLDRIRLQKVMVPKWVRGNVEKATIIQSKYYKGKELHVAALCPSISSNGIAGEALEVKSFDELKANSKKAKGKIIFFNRPMDPGNTNTFYAYGSAVNQRAQGAVEAAKVGGIGVIVRSVTTKHDNNPHVGSMGYVDSVIKIPAVSIGLIDADFLSEAITREPGLKLKINLNCKTYPDVESYNIIAEITGTEKPDEVIVFGGHFDSWDKGVGAHDDGAGCIQALEILTLFQRLEIKPKRTIRCVFFMNEENGLQGGIEYGRYADTAGEKHIAAIESDRGAATPRGFTIQSETATLEKIKSWLPYLQKALIEWVQPGGTGSDISPIKKCKAFFGYVPDAQRYFDFHHSDNDVFSAVHVREFELGSAAMAILVYLINEEGL
jgi:hypothetical protein